jgi:hypothetical protein
VHRLPREPIIITEVLSPGVKRPKREAAHSPAASVKIKNARSYSSIPTIRIHGVVVT